MFDGTVVGKCSCRTPNQWKRSYVVLFGPVLYLVIHYQHESLPSYDVEMKLQLRGHFSQVVRLVKKIQIIATRQTEH